MALVAHRMMLPARHRRNTTQQVARNKVGVLLVPSVADYYGAEMAPGVATPLPTPAASQLHLPQDAAEASGDGSGSKSIIHLAHQEQEAVIHHNVTSAMKQRAEELAKLWDIRSSLSSLAQIKAARDEELRALLDQIVTNEDSSDDDEDEDKEDPF
ncbi:GM10543 [Drosophila sechellia]|uniref:GM10543 n=1 Tax=Drosophila sechellia TaxID=7238 RepID=B4IEM4_DROSE|nr:GM10543 [Drosophila sechellia]